MVEKKPCMNCGNMFFACTGDNICRSCKIQRYNDEISKQIRDGEIEETSFESSIFCPWCGEVCEIDDNYELYDEGEHECYCYHCEKEFTVDTYVSHSFSTTRGKIDDE